MSEKAIIIMAPSMSTTNLILFELIDIICVIHDCSAIKCVFKCYCKIQDAVAMEEKDIGKTEMFNI